MFSYSFITNVRQDFIEVMRRECKNEDTPTALYISCDLYSFDGLSEMWDDVIAFMKKRKHFRVIKLLNSSSFVSLQSVCLFRRLLAEGSVATSTIESLAYFQGQMVETEEATAIAAASSYFAWN